MHDLAHTSGCPFRFCLACSPSDLRKRQLAHAAAQWEAVQALAAHGALVSQAARVATGYRQEAESEVTVLYLSFVHLLACCPGALRDRPWLELIMSTLADHFRVRAAGSLLCRLLLSLPCLLAVPLDGHLEPSILQ